MLEAEHQAQPSTLPIISIEAKDKIIEDMGGVNQNYPVPNLYIFSESVFVDLARSNRGFVKEIYDLLIKKTIEDPKTARQKQDAYINGMAVVFKAFHCANEYGLILSFTNLKSDDVAPAIQKLEESLPQNLAEMSIVQRVLTMPRIPEQQISLNECVKAAGRGVSTIYGQEFNAGAVAMYKTLEVLWPKLYPPQTPPQGSSQ